MPSSSSAAPAAPPPATEQPAYPATLVLSLLAFHRRVGPIFKGTDAKYGKFADLRTVLDAVTPPLLEQGLVLTQTLLAGPGDATLLRTQLLHAPSGQELTSDLALPTLDTLLARLHDLRLAALSGFSFDLQLAAAGTLPPALPPKPTPPVAKAPEANGNGTPPASAEKPLLPPPSPQRQIGLRLDDQIKGFYGTLQSLGTTTNPLHSIGGAVTYFRRYAILAILSLAAEDNDGADYGDLEDRQPQDGRASARGRSRHHSAAVQAPAAVAAPTNQTPAPRPSSPRGRRSAAAAEQEAQATQATAQVAASGSAASSAAPPEADPAVPAAADPVSPATPTTAPQAAELTPAEIQGLIGSIRSLPNESIPPLIAAFRQHFGLPEAALVSDYIRTRDHAAFIAQRVQELTPVAV
ncbi:hypothetical protein KBY93_12320 [Synechococcus sp. J7-Johnson]|uniref:ERF family protein n=1 Tax=Synechococcus sp. J7-Johnson TaxID=2823737 RepID=UPI0020CF1A20|nr:ERF family protein [Synechococcus sp. J7-Johnson]MCP9841412.1 hypothetical protein [Synechococcus sp. J7-Johnson]